MNEITLVHSIALHQKQISTMFNLSTAISLISIYTLFICSFLPCTSRIYKLTEYATIPSYALLILKYLFISVSIILPQTLGIGIRNAINFEVSQTYIWIILFVIDSICLSSFYNIAKYTEIRKFESFGYKIFTSFLILVFLIRRSILQLAHQCFGVPKASELLFLFSFHLIGSLIYHLIFLIKNERFPDQELDGCGDEIYQNRLAYESILL